MGWGGGGRPSNNSLLFPFLTQRAGVPWAFWDAFVLILIAFLFFLDSYWLVQHLSLHFFS